MFTLALTLMQPAAVNTPLQESASVVGEKAYSAETLGILDTIDPADPDTAIAALEALGEAGDASAVEALGELFGAGARGIRRDPARACDYFEQVPAERADAQHNIATCYYDGVGRPRDHAKARVHYARAIAAGFTQSQCALGNMLIKGEGARRTSSADWRCAGRLPLQETPMRRPIAAAISSATRMRRSSWSSMAR